MVHLDFRPSGAGRYTIDCKLTSVARSARRRGSIRVTLTTTFTPTGGTVRSVTQKNTSSSRLKRIRQRAQPPPPGPARGN